MKKLFKEFDMDDKYWSDLSDWHSLKKNKPVIKPITPIKPAEFVYIKTIVSNVSDGIPVQTTYVRRNGKRTFDKVKADLFTLKSAQEFLKNNPPYVEETNRYQIRNEIESLRPY